METSFSDSVSRCELHYAAFRAAFHATLDGLLRHSLEPMIGAGDAPGTGTGDGSGAGAGMEESRGFLDQIPLLRGTALQVQLECLMNSWVRFEVERTVPLPLIDQCVVHAAMELLGEWVRHDNRQLLEIVWRGPQPIRTPHDSWLLSKIRSVQIISPEFSPQDRAQVYSLARLGGGRETDGSTLTAAGQNSVARMEQLLQVVGRWRVSRENLANLNGLLTLEEQGVLEAFCDDHPSLFE